MLLKIGSSGADVIKLQKKLGLNTDGDFGPVTQTMVMAWQTENNLTSDGIVGDKTWNLMFPPAGFNLENLRGIVPDSVLDQIPGVWAVFNISNVLRLSHFLAQCGHESGGFTIVSENLNYSANRLMQIFPKYFPDGLNLSYANNPVKIGSRVYANRMGNGDEASEDGYKFRGRGYIQLTGKNNYARFAGYIGEDTLANPDLVATKYPLASAAFYFNSNKIWTICDRGGDEAVILAVTRAVNIGTIGLDDRIRHFNEYYSLLR